MSKRAVQPYLFAVTAVSGPCVARFPLHLVFPASQLAIERQVCECADDAADTPVRLFVWGAGLGVGR